MCQFAYVFGFDHAYPGSERLSEHDASFDGRAGNPSTSAPSAAVPEKARFMSA